MVGGGGFFKYFQYKWRQCLPEWNIKTHWTNRQPPHPYFTKPTPCGVRNSSPQRQVNLMSIYPPFLMRLLGFVMADKLFQNTLTDTHTHAHMHEHRGAAIKTTVLLNCYIEIPLDIKTRRKKCHHLISALPPPKHKVYKPIITLILCKPPGI